MYACIRYMLHPKRTFIIAERGCASHAGIAEAQCILVDNVDNVDLVDIVEVAEVAGRKVACEFCRGWRLHPKSVAVLG